jgi:hypothetical protein
METNFDNPLPPPETTSASTSANSSVHSSPASDSESVKKMFKKSGSFETGEKKQLDSSHGETRSTLSEETMLINESVDYAPLNYHWFYVNHVQEKKLWLPMSFKDSASLEKAYSQNM